MFFVKKGRRESLSNWNCVAFPTCPGINSARPFSLGGRNRKTSIEATRSPSANAATIAGGASAVARGMARINALSSAT